MKRTGFYRRHLSTNSSFLSGFARILSKKANIYFLCDIRGVHARSIRHCVGITNASWYQNCSPMLQIEKFKTNANEFLYCRTTRLFELSRLDLLKSLPTHTGTQFFKMMWKLAVSCSCLGLSCFWVWSRLKADRVISFRPPTSQPRRECSRARSIWSDFEIIILRTL